MMKLPVQVFLWEYALSPHLGNVLEGLANRGYRARYVVHSETYAHRRAEGWVRPTFPGVEILRPSSSEQIRSIIAQSSIKDVHICAGLRANRYVRDVSASLRSANRDFFVFMETIDERNLLSILKRVLYRAMFFRYRRSIEGVLAAGANTPGWVAARNFPPAKIFDFAYFLTTPEGNAIPLGRNANFRLLFVGNLIARKRVNLVIEALADLPEHVTLDVVGDGPLRNDLQLQAENLAPDRIVFHGSRPMPDISGFMGSADCLVLPSDHDGWGAVVSEAMLAGTPVVCSDGCGASVAVRSSGRGRVFRTFAPSACTEALRTQVAQGPVTPSERAALVDWAYCLTKEPGAAYLDAIIAHLRYEAPRPAPPWVVADALPHLQH